jgi:hypothetical protein
LAVIADFLHRNAERLRDETRKLAGDVRRTNEPEEAIP